MRKAHSRGTRARGGLHHQRKSDSGAPKEQIQVAGALHPGREGCRNAAVAKELPLRTFVVIQFIAPRAWEDPASEQALQLSEDRANCLQISRVMTEPPDQGIILFDLRQALQGLRTEEVQFGDRQTMYLNELLAKTMVPLVWLVQVVAVQVECALRRG
ncbi:MAG: hypothetical protein JW395_2915 [Nitrospira sp.]|nr:hypothetical protein [Nitrospira sp.]